MIVKRRLILTEVDNSKVREGLQVEEDSEQEHLIEMVHQTDGKAGKEEEDQIVITAKTENTEDVSAKVEAKVMEEVQVSLEVMNRFISVIKRLEKRLN